MVKTFNLSEPAWDEMRELLRTYHGIELPTLELAEKDSIKLSGIEVDWVHECQKGCVSYAKKEYQESETCPRCGRPRFRPPTTIHRSKRKLGSKTIEPTKRQPYSSFPTIPIKGLLNDLLAHPIHGPAMLKASEAGRTAAVEDSPIVSDINDAAMMRRLRGPDGYLAPYDVVFSTTSDGLDVYSTQEQSGKENAYFVAARVFQLPPEERFLHRNLHIFSISGPSKGKDRPSYSAHVINEVEDLEKGWWAWSYAAQSEVFVKATCPLQTADTVEQQDQFSSTGAKGAASCFLCPQQGVLVDKTYYSPLFTFDGHSRPDISTIANNLPRTETRTFESYEQSQEELEAAGKKSQRARNKVQRRTGYTDRTSYDVLQIFRLAYPWIIGLDEMHAFWIVFWGLELRVMVGREPSKAGGLVEEAILRMDASIIRSRRLHPGPHGPPPRSLSKKLGDFKAAENKRMVLQYLIPALYEVSTFPTHLTTYLDLTRLSFMTTARFFDIHAPPDPNQRLYDFDDETGRFVLAVASMRVATEVGLASREILNVNRDPVFAPLCIPTIARMLHLSEVISEWGDLTSTAQWQLEGTGGDVRERVRSRLHPVKNMQTITVKLAVVHRVALRYDFPDRIRNPTRPLDEASHPSIPNTALLSRTSKKSRKVPTEEDRALLELWAEQEGLEDIGQVELWQRCRLANGEVVASSLWEKGRCLGRAGERVEVEVGSHEAVEEEKDAKSSSSRFCKVCTSLCFDRDFKDNLTSLSSLSFSPQISMPDRTRRVAEVVKYAQVWVPNQTYPRLLAIVNVLPASVDFSNTFEWIPDSDERMRAVVGVEELRLLVGLTEGVVREDCVSGRPAGERFWWVTGEGVPQATPRVRVPRWE